MLQSTLLFEPDPEAQISFKLIKKFLMCWVENPLIAGYASSLYIFLKFTRICSGISRCSYARSRSCQSSSGRADLSSGAASSSSGHQWSEWSQLHSVSFHRPVQGSWVSIAPYGHKLDLVRGRGCFSGRALLVSFRGPCCFWRPQMRQPIRAQLLRPAELMVTLLCIASSPRILFRYATASVWDRKVHPTSSPGRGECSEGQRASRFTPLRGGMSG